MEAQSTGSAWPDPPYLYKRYTKDNLERLKEAQKTGEFPEEAIHQPPLEDFDLRDLEPPKPPTDAYTVFDQHWQASAACNNVDRATHVRLGQGAPANPE